MTPLQLEVIMDTEEFDGPDPDIVLLVAAIVLMFVCLLLASTGKWNGEPCDNYEIDQRGNVCG